MDGLQSKVVIISVVLGMIGMATYEQSETVTERKFICEQSAKKLF